jgi:hypothetical protein
MLYVCIWVRCLLPQKTAPRRNNLIVTGKPCRKLKIDKNAKMLLSVRYGYDKII